MFINNRKGRIVKFYLYKFIPHKFFRTVLKYFNLNALFFSYAAIDDSQYITQDANYAFRYYGMEERLGYKVMSGFIRQTMTYITPYKLQREYIIDGGKCYIEPKYGWGIKYRTSKLIMDSLVYNRHRENYYPSFFKYMLVTKARVRYYPKVVSIRMIAGAEKNYWHTLSDMLGIIILIDKYNFPKDIPLIIPKKLADQSFFKQIIDYSPDLKRRNWVVQNKEYILAEQVLFCQKMPNQKDQFVGLLQLLNIPDADKNKCKKVYVSRSPERIRFIKNDNEIQEIARQNGYEVVDCDHLSFSEQVLLFSECSHVIGIHGAGLTNIVWRKNAPLSLLELFPEDYVHPGYFWLAKSFDKKYFALTGSNVFPDTSFYLDPKQFEEKIWQMSNSDLG